MTRDDTHDGTTERSITTLTDTARNQLSSRRGFLAGTAALGGGAFALSAGESGVASAQSDDGDEDPSDVEILNYALTLEHLENAFYREGQDQFSEDELAHAELACGIDPCEEVRMMIPEHVQVIGEHEAAHVETITTVIEDLGGDPVAEAEYDFGYDSAGGFLEVAKALENTGVAAYAGAGPSIDNEELVSAALSIHSVEARHASLLNFLNGSSPFPNAFDEPKSMAEVKEIAGQFIVSEDE